MPGRSFSDYAAHYESFDFPALFAEVAVLPNTGYVDAEANMVIAFYVRLLEVLADDDLRQQQRNEGTALAVATKQALDTAMAPHPERSAMFNRACDATYKRLFDFGKHPKVLRMALPVDWKPSP